MRLNLLCHWNGQIKSEAHSHALPPPGKKGRTYICSCMLYLRPTKGAKLLMKAWIKELQDQPWSPRRKANDQPGLNWALNKTAGQVFINTSTKCQNSNVFLFLKIRSYVPEAFSRYCCRLSTCCWKDCGLNDQEMIQSVTFKSWKEQCSYYTVLD